ncbi:MAG: orotate phosphoribosyltransferase [Candidatus Babeliales bacterium]
MYNIKQELIKELYNAGVLKFGTFTLKSGMQSPYYIDFRIIFSHPELFAQLLELAWIKIANLEFDAFAGVPYAAVPYATGLALLHKKPFIMIRKAAKDHGTKNMIEGSIEKNSSCLLIEDLTTTGSSILETTEILEQHDIVVRDIFIFLDREQGGVERLQNKGYRVHTLFTFTEMLHALEELRCIDETEKNTSISWLKEHSL